MAERTGVELDGEEHVVTASPCCGCRFRVRLDFAQWMATKGGQLIVECGRDLHGYKQGGVAGCDRKYDVVFELEGGVPVAASWGRV